MFTNKIIAFIGSGAMGEAMISGLLRKGVTNPEGIIASDMLQERIDFLKQKYGVKGTTSNKSAVEKADVVVLAVKPQRFSSVEKEIHGHIPSEALVISIIAGLTMEKIIQGLNHSRVVRSMPNTPAQIGEGITVWTAAESVSEEQREMTRQILRAFGDEVYIEEESYMDAATALSGTGPAYVFLFMEAMVDAGVHLGFSRKTAEQLVVQTVRGSADYYYNYMKNGTPVHLAHLRNQVTSPGGTSAAALYYLEKDGFRTAISRAIWAAYERSVELGQGKNVRHPESR